MINLMEEIPEMQEWKKQAEDSSFFGIRIGNLSQEELLGVIGWFSQEQKRVAQNHEQELRFYRDIGRI